MNPFIKNIKPYPQLYTLNNLNLDADTLLRYSIIHFSDVPGFDSLEPGEIDRMAKEGPEQKLYKGEMNIRGRTLEIYSLKRKGKEAEMREPNLNIPVMTKEGEGVMIMFVCGYGHITEDNFERITSFPSDWEKRYPFGVSGYGVCVVDGVKMILGIDTVKSFKQVPA